MGVWLPDGWMESAPAGFPLPPLVPPGPPSLPAAEREGGKRVGFGGGGEAAAPRPPAPSPRRAAAAGRGPARKCRFLSSRCQRLGRGTPGGGWEGVLPSQESFFQPFPCPVKWVSISQGLPLLCLRAPDEAENRQALWNRIDSTGQVEGLKERSRMEKSPSTPPPCLSPEKPTRVRGKGEPRGSGGQDAG
jgi:hypothetical protein